MHPLAYDAALAILSLRSRLHQRVGHKLGMEDKNSDEMIGDCCEIRRGGVVFLATSEIDRRWCGVAGPLSELVPSKTLSPASKLVERGRGLSSLSDWRTCGC